YHSRAALGRGSPTSATAAVARRNTILFILIPSSSWRIGGSAASALGRQTRRLPRLDSTGQMRVIRPSGRLGNLPRLHRPNLPRLDRANPRRAGKPRCAAVRIGKLGRIERRQRQQHGPRNALDRRLVRLAHVDQQDLAGLDAARDLLRRQVTDLTAAAEQSEHPGAPSGPPPRNKVRYSHQESRGAGRNRFRPYLRPKPQTVT